MAATPAHLFAPDPAGEQVFASDEHRRVLARCNRNYPIGFSTLLDRLATDPFTYGINATDQMKLSQILSDLTSDGDVIQHADGTFEASEEGWEKITNTKAGKT